MKLLHVAVWLASLALGYASSQFQFLPRFIDQTIQKAVANDKNAILTFNRFRNALDTKYHVMTDSKLLEQSVSFFDQIKHLIDMDLTKGMISYIVKRKSAIEYDKHLEKCPSISLLVKEDADPLIYEFALECKKCIAGICSVLNLTDGPKASVVLTEMLQRFEMNMLHSRFLASRIYPAEEEKLDTIGSLVVDLSKTFTQVLLKVYLHVSKLGRKAGPTELQTCNVRGFQMTIHDIGRRHWEDVRRQAGVPFSPDLTFIEIANILEDKMLLSKALHLVREWENSFRSSVKSSDNLQELLSKDAAAIKIDSEDAESASSLNALTAWCKLRRLCKYLGVSSIYEYFLNEPYFLEVFKAIGCESLRDALIAAYEDLKLKCNEIGVHVPSVSLNPVALLPEDLTTTLEKPENLRICVIASLPGYYMGFPKFLYSIIDHLTQNDAMIRSLDRIILFSTLGSIQNALFHFNSVHINSTMVTELILW